LPVRLRQLSQYAFTLTPTLIRENEEEPLIIGCRFRNFPVLVVTR